ncbi:polymorphic toxin-type HINT domain-containing protein [Urbifossiella limnaea]|uniref:polymorphic toxin-type HINT domain-containing protein n=1 Tax=Urbifossiella limnaea TaxID=2528023 RepID=UPI00119FE732|nr:polymorphic toxin-type HINT domain-containing protein [Urbifossiella limnaea]
MPLPTRYTRFARLLALREWVATRLTRRSQPAPRPRLGVEGLEDRVVPTGRPLPYPVLYAGTGEGPPPIVRAFDAITGALTFERLVADPGFAGGVRVATADFTADGFPDVVTALGPGGAPRVQVLDGKTGDPIPGPLGDLTAYVPWFHGGVSVAAADVDADGVPDLITAAGAGGGPHVRVFRGADGRQLASFFAFEPDFAGGVSIAAADLTGDGRADLVVGAGPGGGPRVRVLDLATGRPAPGPLGDFFAFDAAGRAGVAVGADWKAGDVDADGTPDLVVGSGPGIAGEVKVFSGRTGASLGAFSPFGPGMTAGVRVALCYADDDEFADVVAATGPGRTPAEVRVFHGATGVAAALPTAAFLPFGPGAAGGVNLAASNDPVVPSMSQPTISPGAPAAGAPVTITVTLSPASGQPAPTGAVTFTAVPALGGAPVVLGSGVPLTPYGDGSLATLTATAPAAGAYSVTAAYGGDVVYSNLTTAGWLMVSGGTSPPPPPPPPPGGTSPPPAAAGIHVEADADPVVKGEPVWFTLTSDDTVPDYTAVEWDFDYQYGTFTVDATGPDPEAETAFTTAGARTVAARLVLVAGAPQVYSLAVNVRYPAPVVTVPEEPVTTTAMLPTPMAVEVDAERPIDHLDWYVSFEGEEEWLDPSVHEAPEHYVFPWYGDWSVRVVATDVDGNVGENWFAVTADDFTPVEEVSPVPTVAEGTPSVFTIREVDPDTWDTLTVYADWGEGKGFEQVDPDTFTVDTATDTISFPHTYAKDGTFTAVLRVENDSGTHTDVSAAATVTNVWPSWAINAGTQIAHKATSNQDVWAIRPGQTLLFDDVRAAGRRVWNRQPVGVPSTATPWTANPPTPGVDYTPAPPESAMTDALDVKYHWRISLDSSSHVTGELPQGSQLDEEIVTQTPYLSLPYYRAGVIYHVQAWATDSGARPAAADAEPGLAPVLPPGTPPPPAPDRGSAPQRREFLKVIVDDPAGYANPGRGGMHTTHGTSGGTWITDQVYGTLSVLNTDGSLMNDPDVYARYSMYLNHRTAADYVPWQTLDVRYELDAATREWLGNGVTVQYRVTVAVYEINGSSIQLKADECQFLSYTPSNGSGEVTFHLPGLPPGRQALVQVSADLLRDGQLWKTTSRFDFVRDFQGDFTRAQTLYQPQVVYITGAPPPDTGGGVLDTLAILRELAGRFGPKVNALVAAFTSPSGITTALDNLKDGFVGAMTELKDKLASPQGLLRKLMTAVLGPTAVQSLQNITEWNWDNLLPALLEYAGLTWDHVYDVARRQLGAGNLAALERVAGWFEGIDPAAGPAGLRTLFDRIKNDPVMAGLDLGVLNADVLLDQVKGAIQSKVQEAMLRAAAQAVAKFVPGAGAFISLYNALGWLNANKDGVLAAVDALLDALAAAAVPGNSAAVKTKLVEMFDLAMDKALSFAGSQLGVGNMGERIKSGLAFVPSRVDAALIAAFARVAAAVPPGTPAPGTAAAPGGTAGGMYDGRMAAAVTVSVDGKTYHLWVAQETGRTAGARAIKVKLVQVSPGGNGLVLVLDPKMFLGKRAPAALNALVAAAVKLQKDTLPAPGAPPAAVPMATLRALQQQVTAALGRVKDAIQAHACVALGTGCFAAGTKLLTRAGWRAVEDIRAGDEVLAQGEYDPAGVAEWKAVEETFRRTDVVLHVHAGGRVIRTTPEHPFYVAGEGWTAAGALRGGDRLATLGGAWVGVEEVFETGVYEAVYNLRVADHHTYFVGDDHWGFAVWAHNTYTIDFLSGYKVVEQVKSQPGITGQLTQAQEVTIIQTIRGEGKYGAMGQVENSRAAVVDLVQFEMWFDRVSAPANYTPDLAGVLKGHFKLPCVKTAHDIEEKNIKDFSGPRPMVPAAPSYPAVEITKWKGLIYSSTWTSPWSTAVNIPVRHGLSDADALNRGYVAARATFNGDVHGHHIVFKEGADAGPTTERQASKPVAAEARDILLYYGINPYWDKENLAYAPAHRHWLASIEDIRDRLKAAYLQHGSRGDIVTILQDVAQRYINESLRGMRNYVP